MCSSWSVDMIPFTVSVTSTLCYANLTGRYVGYVSQVTLRIRVAVTVNGRTHARIAIPPRGH